MILNFTKLKVIYHNHYWELKKSNIKKYSKQTIIMLVKQQYKKLNNYAIDVNVK